jgi:Hypervirulence associated proteins TUDOR domain
MLGELRRGDRVEWSFRGRRVVGRIRRKLTARTEIDGRPVAASKDDPRYVVRSDGSGKETVRRAETLRRLD